MYEMLLESGVPSAAPIPSLIEPSMLISLQSSVVQVLGRFF
jgi:hypothetical protein